MPKTDIRRLAIDLLPHGVVRRIAAQRELRRRAAMVRERAAMLRSVEGATYVGPPRLNMGCGSHHEPGWINADGSEAAPLRIWLDPNTPLPFDDGALDVVFSEHFLEHIDLPTARHFIKESYRVLRREGVWRVSCPDLYVIARLLDPTVGEKWRELARIYESIGDFRPDELTRPEHVVNWAFYGHHHRHLWTFDELRVELEAVGFHNVERVPFGVSRAERAAIEIRRAEAPFSIIAEATKP